ncbi:hypothetical protein GJ496_005208 [Pomphorhynchus laevis]|nr:hypothetical protein GJ496_005208 [Pomphorhynchus laevis]
MSSEVENTTNFLPLFQVQDRPELFWISIMDENYEMEDDTSMTFDDYGDNFDEVNLYNSDNDDLDFDLENQYYNAKSLKHENPVLSLESFMNIAGSSDKKCEWGFKALKQILKILYGQKSDHQMINTYKQLLKYGQPITPYYMDKSLSSILDYISTSCSDPNRHYLLENIYRLTIDSIDNDVFKNERLWFKANLKLGKLYFEQENFDKVEKIIVALRQSCTDSNGLDDVANKGTQLLEIFALEIQLHTVRKDNRKLKNLYQKSLCIKSAIPHPFVMGVIRECGGIMHLREQSYEHAYNDFFESFKSYDEAGNQRRTLCLKYLVLTNMLMNSTINPFDSPETASYRTNPDVVVLNSLLEAYQKNDIQQFVDILGKNRQMLLQDPFIKEHIEFLHRKVQVEVLIKLLRPYTLVSLSFLASKLNVDVNTIENLLCCAIHDESIYGQIDQENNMFHHQPFPKKDKNAKFEAINSWIGSLQRFKNQLDRMNTM